MIRRIVFTKKTFSLTFIPALLRGSSTFTDAFYLQFEAKHSAKKTDATADQTKRWCFCSDALSLWYTDAQQSLQAAYNECFSSQIPPVLVV